MSERAHGYGVPADSAQDDRRQVARPLLPSVSTSARPQTDPNVSHTEPSSALQGPPSGPQRGLELPPLSQSNPAHHGVVNPSATRIAGVASILNPPEDEAQTGQRRKLSQLQSPVSAAQRLPPLAASVSNDPSSASDRAISPRAPRRVLTPRSPSELHRAASLGKMHPQAGVINAQRVPFPPSPHRHTVQPGTSGVPPLPTPPARLQTAGYGFPTPAPQQQVSRRASTGTNRGRKLSSSASPSTSYSSYSQAGQTSPMGRYASTTGAPMQSSYAEAWHDRGGDEYDSHASGSQRHMGVPISSSGGQNVYQMMTLETTSGTVQLPVDVQAASRVADEKRRRNAGASARFRQRRKEKEKEASTSIARLEQQVKELSEQADFYRNDRANLLAVIRTVPGMEHHLQRPPSPRRLRGSIGSIPSSMTSRRTSYMPPPDSEPQSPETGRNVRRRTSTSTFSLPPLPPPGPPLQPNYNQAGYGASAGPQPTGSLPSLSAPSQRQQTSGSASAMQNQSQGGPYNSYGGRYHDSGPKEGR